MQVKTCQSILDNEVVWELSRKGLDLFLGLYRKRLDMIANWDILRGAPSVLDIGCGSGQYAKISRGDYLGIDLSERYIKHARKRHQRPNQSFLNADVVTELEKKSKFDLVLMVDILHHLSDQQCASILAVARDLAVKCIIIFEPIADQPHPVGQWMVQHDRGHYVRSSEKLHSLLNEAKLTIIESNQLWLGPINSKGILCHPNTN